jgi:DNA-binding transcriptional ArsR family regulator
MSGADPGRPEGAGQPDGLADSLARALGHSSRARLLHALNDRPGQSVRELAELVGVPTRSVRHHLSELRKAGLVEATEQKSRRGVVEQFFRVAVPLVVDDAEFARLGPTDRLRLVTQALTRSFETATQALVAGTFYARSDFGVVTIRADLDARGWEEFVAAHRRAYAEIERVKAESAERLREGSEEPIGGASTLIWIEMPRS